MSIGKVILVILATLVIFSTGLITGVVLMKQVPTIASVPPKPPPPQQGPGMQQFLHRVEGELDLSPQQHDRIGTILRESQERTRGLARSEFGKIREQIRAELKPGQREKFERLLRQRQRRAQEMMMENRARFTNGFRSNEPLPPPNQQRPAAAEKTE